MAAKSGHSSSDGDEAADQIGRRERQTAGSSDGHSSTQPEQQQKPTQPQRQRKETKSSKEETSKAEPTAASTASQQQQPSQASTQSQSESDPQPDSESNSESQSDSSSSSSSPMDDEPLPSHLPHEDVAERMFRCVRIFAGSSIGFPFSLSRFLGRWWWSWMFRKLCTIYENEPLHLEVEKGATEVLPFLFDKVLTGEWEALSSCVEERLLAELKSATEALKGKEGKSDIDFSIDVSAVRASRLVGLRVIFGGERNTPTMNKTLITALTPVGMSHFLLDEDSIDTFIKRRSESGSNSSMKSSIRRGSELLRDAMKRGALVRADVLCRAEQTLTLKTDTLMMVSSQPETLHYLRFEASMDPNDDEEIEQGSSYFKWREGWKLVDINFVLKGNYPFNFANFKDERSINAIMRDARFPFHAASAEEHPAMRHSKGDGYAVVTKQQHEEVKQSKAGEEMPAVKT